eukprot:6811803-Alexandrium_andersonii.AAC.1
MAYVWLRRAGSSGVRRQSVPEAGRSLAQSLPADSWELPYGIGAAREVELRALWSLAKADHDHQGAVP